MDHESDLSVPIECPHLIAVEGTHEVHFVQAIARNEGVRDVQVLAVGGKDQMPSRLPALAERPDFIDNVRSLGVIRDADDCAQAAFQSVQGALDKAGLPVPGEPLEAAEGRLAVNGDVPGPRVTVRVIILPGNGKPGALEDLCVHSVRDAPEAICVDGLFDCLQGINEITLPKSPMKAWTSAFIATQERADVHVGIAAKRGYWPLDHPTFDALKAFIQQVAQ